MSSLDRGLLFVAIGLLLLRGRFSVNRWIAGSACITMGAVDIFSGVWSAWHRTDIVRSAACFY